MVTKGANITVYVATETKIQRGISQTQTRRIVIGGQRREEAKRKRQNPLTIVLCTMSREKRMLIRVCGLVAWTLRPGEVQMRHMCVVSE